MIAGANKRLLYFGGLAVVLVFALVTALLNVSTPGREVEGCLEGCTSADAGETAQLRVLSLNVLHGRPDYERLAERLSLIASEIVRLQVDIALLQEVPWTRQFGSAASYLAQNTGMNHVYLRANGNRRLIGFEEGEVVLSRYPLLFTEFRELEPQAGFFEHRVVLHVVAQTPAGPLDLYVTHLTNGAAHLNRVQADALLAYVERTARHPALVAGDFNAQEDSLQIRKIGQEWMDAYRIANPDIPGLTCCIEHLSSPPGNPLTKRIDYIFVVPAAGVQLNVSSVQVVFDQPQRIETGWLWASDHAGLLVTIEPIK
jgi:endonuclease/exonuclease/phosphatase family metal-dependent hydrolase